MSRRADPEPTFQARRDAIRNTLTGSGMSLETAERWCDAWEIEAARPSLPRDSSYWQLGSDLIAARAGREAAGLVKIRTSPTGGRNRRGRSWALSYASRRERCNLKALGLLGGRSRPTYASS